MSIRKGSTLGVAAAVCLAALLAATADAEAQTATAPRGFKVKAGVTATVRSAPNGGVIGTAPSGQRYAAIGVSGSMYQIWWGGSSSAWISMNDVVSSPGYGVRATAGWTLADVRNDVNNTVGFGIIGGMPLGSFLATTEPFRQSGNFIQVWFRGVKGWEMTNKNGYQVATWVSLP